MKTLKAAALAGAMLVSAASAQAAVVTNSVTFTVANGAYAGFSSTGTLSYNNALSGGTFAIVTPISLSFSINGDTLNTSNAISPFLLFVNSALAYINFVLVDGVNGTDGSPYGVTSLTFNNDLTGSANTGYFVTATLGYSDVTPPPSEVPLPAGGAALLGALGMLGLARRRRKAA